MFVGTVKYGRQVIVNDWFPRNQVADQRIYDRALEYYGARQRLYVSLTIITLYHIYL